MGFNQIFSAFVHSLFLYSARKITHYTFSRVQRKRLKIDVYQLPRLKITFGANKKNAK